MVSLTTSVQFNLVVKLISTLIVIIPLITCNQSNITLSPGQKVPIVSDCNGTGIGPINCNNQSSVEDKHEPRGLNFDDEPDLNVTMVKSNLTDHQMTNAWLSFLKAAQNYNITFEPFVRILNGNKFKFELVGIITRQSNGTSSFNLTSKKTDKIGSGRSIPEVNNLVNSSSNVVNNSPSATSEPVFPREVTGNSTLVTSLTKKPDTNVTITNTVMDNSESILKSTETRTPKVVSSQVTNSTCPCATDSQIVPTVSFNTSNPQSNNRKPDPVRVSSTLVNTNESNNSSSRDRLKTVPEMLRTPESLFKANTRISDQNHSYNHKDNEINVRSAENNQTQSRAINDAVVRQIERLLHQSKQRQVPVQPTIGQSPSQSPPVNFVNKYPLTLPVSGQNNYNYNQANNQQNGNTINTRANNQHSREKLNNVNNQPNFLNNNQITGQYKPSPYYGQPYAVEEIVHSQRSPNNQRSRDETEPEHFVKIVRHYFPNALSPVEVKHTVTRQNLRRN